MGHLMLELKHLLAVADLGSGSQTVEQGDLHVLDAVAGHDGGKDIHDAA